MKIKNQALRLILGFFMLAPGAAISDEFSIVVVPDTQLYAERYPAIIEAQMQWIADNQATENIIYVAQLGDLKDDIACDNKLIAAPVGGARTEWEIVDDAFDIIETATSPAQPNGIPYGTVAGNHDFEQVSGNCPINWNDPAERILTTYDSLFGPTQFVGTAYYGGNRVAGSSEDNYTLFESGGVRFIAINLGYREGPNPADTPGVDNSPEQTWADGLLTTHSDRLGIITSHYFMRCNNVPAGNGSCTSSAGINTIGSYGGQVYDRLKNNPNLFAMLSAHKRGESYRRESRTGMQPVHLLMSNYQSLLYPTGNPALASTFSTLQDEPAGFGDSGFMRIMRFDTDTGIVDIETFSPPVPDTPAAPAGGGALATPAIAARSLLQSVYNPTITGNPLLDDGLHDGTASNMSLSFAGYVTTLPAFDIFECDGVSGGTCTTPIGTISFPGNSGTQTDGTGFSLTYTCGGIFCDSAGYDDNDIQNVNWTIDAGSGEITALTMRLDTDPGCFAGTSPLPCGQSTVNFTFISTGLTENTASGGSCSVGSGGGTQCISGIGINGANLFVPQ